MVKNIVILTGAGVSAESGVSTFRDRDGVWAKYNYRDVATPEGFAKNPDLVHGFYNARRAKLQDVQPNAAHYALARLETALRERNGSLTLVTQNVDDLHERAGSKNLLHIHGELAKANCNHCNDICELHVDLSTTLVCSACTQPGGMRPYVVWFGETPRYLGEASDALQEADLFVSIGTSGAVYPAAGFVSMARELKIATLELNLEPSENADIFDDAQYGLAGEVVPAWVESFI